LEEYSSISR